MTSNWKLFGLGALAMLAFAGNSILNRYALVDGHAGAWSFTLIRLLSGAIMLALLTRLQFRGGSWAGAASLLVYAAGFSFAYQALDAGLGALILFTAVQFTMMGRGVAKGERLGAFQWLGVVIAFAAMVWLLWPAHRISETVPETALGNIPLWAAASMSLAGMGWGVYSLIGRGASSPLLATSGNFARAALMALILTIPIFLISPEARPAGTALIAAVTSGAITSGLGYAIWYAALPGLSRIQAGIMQLTVPALAALGGVLFLGEILTPRLMISTVLILAGVGAATLSRRKA